MSHLRHTRCCQILSRARTMCAKRSSRNSRAGTAFPDVSTLMQPSDSLVPRRPPLRSSLANGLPRCGGLVLRRRTGTSADRCNAGDISTPAPHKPTLSREESRVSQVPGPSSSRVPWSSTPAGCVPPLAHLAVRSPSPSNNPRPSASGSFANCGAASPRPTRSRTYASPDPLPAPAQGSLPARAGSPLAGRDLTGIRKYVSQPSAPREPAGHDRTLLDAYRPNETFHLSQHDMRTIHTTPSRPQNHEPTGRRSSPAR